jgi:hypothetical protein
VIFRGWEKMIVLSFLIMLSIYSIKGNKEEVKTVFDWRRNDKKNNNMEGSETVISINLDTLYIEDLPPNSFKIYLLKVNRTAIMMLCMKLEEKLDVEIQIQGNASRISMIPKTVSNDMIEYLYYARSDGELRIKIMNSQLEKNLKYSIFFDLSQPISSKRLKNIPLKDGAVIYYIDLKKGQQILINFDSYPKTPLEICAYSLYYSYSSDYEGYLLKSFTKVSNNFINFTSDLQGRYYILVRSNQPISSLSFTSTIFSSFWIEPFFWPSFTLLIIFIISISFYYHFLRKKTLTYLAKYTLFSIYSSFITLAFFCILCGAYDTRSPSLIPIFYSSIISYGLSLGLQIHASYLRSKNPFIICPHCLKKIDSRRTTFCCDRIINRASNNWFFTPIALGLLFFLVYSSLAFHTVTQFEVELPVLTSISLSMGGLGCLLGGIIAWRINWKVDQKKSWSFILVGIALSILFPIFLSLTLYLDFFGIFEPVKYVELVYPNAVRLLVRVNTLPTIPQGSLLIFAIFIAFLSYYLLRQLRIALISI